MAGRPRKPDNQREPIAPGKPDCPSDMAPAGRRLWSIVVDGLPGDVASLLDGPTLEGMCRWYAEYLKWHNADDIDEYKRVQMMVMCWKQFEGMAKAFGLTPADRSRLKGPAKKRDSSKPSILKIAGIDAG